MEYRHQTIPNATSSFEAFHPSSPISWCRDVVIVYKILDNSDAQAPNHIKTGTKMKGVVFNFFFLGCGGEWYQNEQKHKMVTSSGY